MMLLYLYWLEQHNTHTQQKKKQKKLIQQIICCLQNGNHNRNNQQQMAHGLWSKNWEQKHKVTMLRNVSQ
jgi:hypothetical protein